LQYRRILQDLRDLNKTCEELAEDRDRTIVEVEKLTALVVRLRKELTKLRGEQA
jgi:hypothetical protein